MSKRKRTAVGVGPPSVTMEEGVAALRVQLGSAKWDDMLTGKLSKKELKEYWGKLSKAGAQLCEKYSWAVPSEQALRICSEFGPLIEIGGWQGLMGA